MAKKEIARFQKWSGAEASKSICMWERVNNRVIFAEIEYFGNKKNGCFRLVIAKQSLT